MPNRHRGPDAERRVLDAYVKLSRALATVDAAIHRPLGDVGLTASRFGALEALWHLGPLNQRDLGRKILKSSGNVSVVLDGLERDGLVGRERDPADRRNVIVSLTDAGRERIEAVYPAHVARLVAAFAHLQADDVAHLAQLAKALGTGIASTTPTPSGGTRMTVPYAPRGLHHVTAIAGDPVENLRFYRDVMGLRLVKKSVNQDDPTTYHLFYADADGHPGTDLTFFPWPHADQGNPGVGVVQETYLTVPHGTLEAWQSRLRDGGARIDPIAVRFGDRVLPFADPHGLRLALVEGETPFAFTAWDGSPVPAAEQIRGLHGARAPLRELAATERFLTQFMGFERIGEDDGWVRFALPASDGAAAADGAGRVLDLREVPEGRRGAWGVGSVHHLAWTVDDDAHQVALRGAVARAGRRPSEVIDRFWFRSVYFMEPGGVLFELATTGPGFAVDEEPTALGELLILPPWLEPHRAQIEGALPDLSAADAAVAALR